MVLSSEQNPVPQASNGNLTFMKTQSYKTNLLKYFFWIYYNSIQKLKAQATHVRIYSRATQLK